MAYALLATRVPSREAQQRARRALVRMVVRPERVAATPSIPRVVWPRDVPLGTPVATLTIPTAGVRRDVVVQGVDALRLEEGPGHYPTSPLPGQPGNLAIAGHRTTWLRPFYDLQAVVPGDHAVLAVHSLTWVYTVVSVRSVLPTDVSVAGPRRGWWLTLTTCTPRYSAARRLVVLARLDVAATRERAPRRVVSRRVVLSRVVVVPPAPRPPRAPSVALLGVWAASATACAGTAIAARRRVRLVLALAAVACWWEACGAVAPRLPPGL
ncbi:MAG: class E sortase [Actinomycetota bacterium]|nr:class E sortase [Actinomycetota bacterium]